MIFTLVVWLTTYKCFVALRRSRILLFFLFLDGILLMLVFDEMITNISCIHIKKISQYEGRLLLAITIKGPKKLRENPCLKHQNWELLAIVLTLVRWVILYIK